MKLKTRLKIARFEVALAFLILASGLYVEVMRPHPMTSSVGALVGFILPILLLGPICVTSWRRLRATQAQLAELGPDAAPSADLWTAPGAPGVVGVMVIVAAVAAALVPALLLRA
jgi:hypothetical protein